MTSPQTPFTFRITGVQCTSLSVTSLLIHGSRKTGEMCVALFGSGTVTSLGGTNRFVTTRENRLVGESIMSITQNLFNFYHSVCSNSGTVWLCSSSISLNESSLDLIIRIELCILGVSFSFVSQSLRSSHWLTIYFIKIYGRGTPIPTPNKDRSLRSSLTLPETTFQRLTVQRQHKMGVPYLLNAPYPPVPLPLPPSSTTLWV